MIYISFWCVLDLPHGLLPVKEPRKALTGESVLIYAVAHLHVQQHVAVQRVFTMQLTLE